MYTLATVAALAGAAILAANAFLAPMDAPAPGAEAPALTVEAEPFSGRAVYGPGCPEEDAAGVWECYDLASVNFDDPRFQGSVRMLANSAYMDDGIYRNQFTITTEDGAWVGASVPGMMIGEASGSPSVHLFEGEGAYEGLYAVAAVDLNGGAFHFEGHVVHGGFPEIPGY